jgi:opacity protein-like surface antigen
MKKLLVATGMVVCAVVSANAVEVGSVKITPNVEVGWQKGKWNGDFSGVATDGYTFTGNFNSNAKTEFGVGQVGLETQYRNYFGGVKYTHDKLKGTIDIIVNDDQGTHTRKSPYSLTLERYLAYAGYDLKLNSLELKPYASIGYFNSNLDKGDFAGVGLIGKLNLPYGFGVFASAEYDKTFGGKTRVRDAIGKDIKDTWEISAGISKKISFAETYVKAYYREHKSSATFTRTFSDGTPYTQTSNYDLKISGIMIGLNF